MPFRLVVLHRSPDVELPAGAPVDTALLDGPARTPVADAIAAARERLSAGQSAFNAPAPVPNDVPADAGAVVDPAAGAEPAPEPEPVAGVTWDATTNRFRGTDGRFVNPDGSPLEGADAGGAPIAPAAPAGTDAPVAGAEGEELGDGIVVEIPNRFPGQAPLPIAVSDEATAERLRQLVNGYRRTEELSAQQAEVARTREEIDDFRTALEVDPIGIVLGGTPPEQRMTLAMALLTQNDVWESLQAPVDVGNGQQVPLIEYLGDPTGRRLAAAQVEIDRRDARDLAQQRITSRRESVRTARTVEQAVRTIAPETLSDDAREVFVEDAIADVIAHLKRTRQSAIHPHDIAPLLARRLAVHGMSVDDAARRLIEASAPRDSAGRAASPTARPASRAAVVPGRQPTPAGGRTPEQLRANADARRAVAAQAPAGAGAPTGATLARPPQGSGVREAIAHARQNLAAARPR